MSHHLIQLEQLFQPGRVVATPGALDTFDVDYLGHCLWRICSTRCEDGLA